MGLLKALAPYVARLRKAEAQVDLVRRCADPGMPVERQVQFLKDMDAAKETARDARLYLGQEALSLRLDEPPEAELGPILEELEREHQAALMCLPSDEAVLLEPDRRELADALRGVREALAAQGRLFAQLRGTTEGKR